MHAERVAAFIAANPGARPTRIAQALGIQRRAVTKALTDLKAAGRVRVTQPKHDCRGREYHLAGGAA